MLYLNFSREICEMDLALGLDKKCFRFSLSIVIYETILLAYLLKLLRTGKYKQDKCMSA